MGLKDSERVMVIPTSFLVKLGVFQGFSDKVDHYVEPILKSPLVTFRERQTVETDPAFKQIVCYVVLRSGSQYFHYTRGKAGSEDRLKALRSIGVGGHISDCDRGLFGDAYREGMLREVMEEIHLDSNYAERCLGLINDDSTPVGQVHLGIVHLFDLAEPKARRKEQVLTKSGFAPFTELQAQRSQFESWSQILLDRADLFLPS